MRSRSRARIAVSTLATAGVVLGLALPTAPVAASEPEGPDGTASAAPQSTVAVAIDVTKDGNGPFTPTDGAGGDASEENGIVRTMDAVTYRVSLNSNDGTSTNERFSVTAPAGTSWAGVPTICAGPGSAVSGAVLTCNIGTLGEGRTVSVPIVLGVSGDLQNGDTLAVPVTATADEAENGTVTAVADAVTVSAAARYNLSKNVHASSLRTDVTGPDGTTKGLQLIYPIAVDWQPLVPGQGLLGFEKSAGPMTFSDDLSQILGAVPSDAVLWNGGNPVCGPNEPGDWRMGGLPGGSGGGEQAVTDSGAFSCEQSAPGRAVDVTITGTVTDPEHVPSRSLTNGPIAGGAKPYFVSGYISLWMRNPPTGTSVESVNTFTPLQTTSVSGAPNFPGGTEPTGDNSAERNVLEYADGSAQKRLLRVIGDGRAVERGSARDGDPWATPGTLLRSDVSASNRGLASFENAILCDTFDRDTQHVTRVGGGGVAAFTSGMTSAKVQYAAYDMTAPSAGQKATCDDEDGPWYDQPEDVPGGIDAVGAVRATGDVPGGSDGTLYSYVTTEDAADGTRAYDFGHAWFGDRSERWAHDVWSDADLGAGPLSDSVILTENLARIQKKIVDPGHDAADTPDETTFTVAGDTVDYALYPSLTNGNTTGKETSVTVRDVLPNHVTYVAGSASEVPEIDTTKDDDGNDVQRLTWTTAVRPNEAIDPITYTAAVSKLAPAGAITNVTDIASPTDKSPQAFRNAQRAVQVVATGGVGVEKTAVEPVVVSGDHLEWDLGYTNIDATPIDGLDVIDVLPYRGDTRNSTFHGTVGLAEPIAVATAAGERVRYTSRDPRDVVLDAADPSNQGGGTTTWCSASAFGTEGCPAGLADVTAARILRTAPVGVGETVTHRVVVATAGQRDGDAYTNRFGLRASNLALPVQSNPATVTVVAGSIGDFVWSDEDGDGLQDDDEAGIADVSVRLTGSDDRGDAVRRTTTTDGDGEYTFDDLRPGSYSVHWTAPDGREFTKELVGDDRAIDSDADASGVTAPVELAAIRSDEGQLEHIEQDCTVDAGLLPATDTPTGPPVTPGGPGAPGTPGHPGNAGNAGSAGSSGTPGGRDDAEAAGTGDGSRGPARGGLAFTGADGLGLAAVTAVLLLALGGLLAARRRRTRGSSQR
ncbi:SdrD B-like domain-containing protein [Curtobacterium flaccumfaciens]|uniref:SdrD B-like domain-containing protein n=1 Tax=Curtobacterium flaccumfaciens TaxID=2035 RepID=UPI001BDF31FA|nr:SdrD B-like domain-containing protein [Curtobacterium flaccumfaciens]MBT1607660.1 MSCRAMM family adhesin SdrC [Curtobacterium flaccumfaciens pv. betae]MBT1655813.1 MSCRAMM family adhesin SdrC [Curtobacterium flaccumfaciens pv. betae]MCS0471581.1 carboxypeptidase regulatory-like domain-containing protein [Curtobacterium flaccumfaciens pv. betae]MCS0473336.1 carboxypeptidase regulatory-like domain-containing protein [Curtobacterium flaccumfaciens pv. betae]MCS0477975.1 carboxypeptidase regula